MISKLSRPTNATNEGERLRNKLNEVIDGSNATGTLVLGGQHSDQLNTYVSVLGGMTAAQIA